MKKVAIFTVTVMAACHRDRSAPPTPPAAQVSAAPREPAIEAVRNRLTLAGNAPTISSCDPIKTADNVDGRGRFVICTLHLLLSQKDYLVWLVSDEEVFPLNETARRAIR